MLNRDAATRATFAAPSSAAAASSSSSASQGANKSGRRRRRAPLTWRDTFPRVQFAMEVVAPAVYLVADPFATHARALALTGDLRVSAQLVPARAAVDVVAQARPGSDAIQSSATHFGSVYPQKKFLSGGRFSVSISIFHVLLFVDCIPTIPPFSPAQARHVRCGYADVSAMDERRVFRGWCVESNAASGGNSNAGAANAANATPTDVPLLAPVSLSLAVHLGFSTLLQTGGGGGHKRKRRNNNGARRLRYAFLTSRALKQIIRFRQERENKHDSGRISSIF
jgi:hypothetical protein